MNFNILKNKNSFDKFTVDKSSLVEALNYLKNNAVFDFDRLNTIIAIDLGIDTNQFELIYDLYSSKTGNMGRISVFVDRNSPHVPSVTGIFKSAYFDECEIYDMFGVIFDNNPNLKRLLMPKGWIGYPLRKDYKQEDDRIEWNNR